MRHTNNITKKEARTGNMRLAQWGVTCKFESPCFYSALVQVDSLVLLSPPLRQAQKRYKPF
jgi:hypothetical protein